MTGRGPPSPRPDIVVAMTWLRHTATVIVMYPIGVLIWHWRGTHNDPHPWGQCLLFGLAFSAIAGVVSLLQHRQRERRDR